MPVTNYHCVEGLLLGETGPSGRRDYLTDGLGSVVGTTDQTAAVRNVYRYKPYGEALVQTGPDPAPRFLWTGAGGSRASGAPHAGQYNRARHYGRGQGAWTGVDPLWPEESAYGYARGNPTSRVDPSGMQAAIPGLFCSPRGKCQGSPCCKEPGGPCAYAKRVGAAGNSGGGVVCCEGVAYSCDWISIPWQPGLHKCVVAHEDVHASFTKCVGFGFSRPSMDDYDLRFNECLAYSVEIKCDQKNRSECNKLKGAGKKACERDYRKRICQLCGLMGSKLRCPSGIIPSICGSCKTNPPVPPIVILYP